MTKLSVDKPTKMVRFLFASLFVLTLVFTQDVYAVKKPRLRFSVLTHLPALNMKIRLMPDARAVPLSSPSVYQYILTRGQEEKKIDMYDPHDLWVRTQHAGKWTDAYHNTLIVASVTQPYPRNFPMKHITPDEFDEAVADTKKPATWTEENLVQWVKDFTGGKNMQTEIIKHPPSNLSKLIHFSFDGVAAQTTAYAFLPRLSPAQKHKATGTWIFAFLILNPMMNQESTRSTITQRFLSSIAWEYNKRTGRTSLSKTFQKKDGKSTGKSPVFIQSRKRVADSIKNLKDWWFVETSNYIIVSNMKRRHRLMVRDLQTYAEKLRGAYSTLIKPQVQIDSVSVMRVFATPEEYVNYVGPDYEWTGGLWIPMKSELVIKPINWGGSKEQRKRVLSVTFHEGFHQYIHYALHKQVTSPWFNEGHASFFEAAEVSRSKLYIPENTRYIDNIKSLAKAGKLDPTIILPMSYPQFYGNTAEERNRNYALAWALIYYLRKEAPFADPLVYSALPDKYCNAIMETSDFTMATATTFAGVNMKEFKKDFTAFWKSKRRRAKAARNNLFKGN